MGQRCFGLLTEYANTDSILCGRPVNDWHVRCWFVLREVQKASEASPYLEKRKDVCIDNT